MFCPSCGSQIDACASICFNCARRSTESGGGRERGAGQVRSVDVGAGGADTGRGRGLAHIYLSRRLPQQRGKAIFRPVPPTNEKEINQWASSMEK